MKKYYEVVEICPHCDNENIYPMWNTEISGFIAKCKYCGEEILLCDECQHTILQDGEVHNCDWCRTPCGGKCHRGETKNDEVIYFEVECFNRTLFIKYPKRFGDKFHEVREILSQAYDKWHAVEDIEDDEEREYVQYACLEEFMVEELSKTYPDWIKWKSVYYEDDESDVDDEWIINKDRWYL